jgi:hypothetical protein
MPDQAQPHDADPADGLQLARLLRSAVEAQSNRGAPWLAENAVDEDGKPVMTSQAAHLLLTQPRKSWVTGQNMKALARLFGWQDAAIYIPNALAIGLNPPSNGAFAGMLPGWVDQLPVSVQMHLREEITLFGRAHGLTD